VASRAHIEELIYNKSPRIGFIPNYKGKSEVWTHFLIITVDNVPVNFASCVSCRSVVTYHSRTGTGSMTRHNCLNSTMYRRYPTLGGEQASRVKQEQEQEEEQEQQQEQQQQGDDEHETHPVKQELLLPQDKLTDLLDKRTSLIKQTMSVFNSNEFVEFTQMLVDLGAEYGKFDVRQVLNNHWFHNLRFNNDSD
jgi:hypothetical protein